MPKKKTSEKAYQPPDRARTQGLYLALRPQLEEELQGIYRGIRLLLEQHGFTPTIKYRVKRFEAYYEKLMRSARKRKGAPAITDLLGLRIICPFLEDVETVEGLIGSHFEVLETVRKAAVHSFREFGYDSVHLLVRLEKPEKELALPHARRVCEIQLRTILQDAWAEVEHELVYKSKLSWPNESIRRKLAALNATLTLSDLTFQEIRDYQKGVLALDKKRRTALEKALELPGFPWPPAGETRPEAEAEEEPSAAMHRSPLEKAMVEALSAHSHNRFDQAIELYSQILGMRLSPQNRALIYNHRGMALFALGRPREALRDFTRAIEYDGEYLRALCNRGLVYRAQKRHTQSLEDFNRALHIDPSFTDALLGRAQTWLTLSFPDRALSDCQKALEINPELDPARTMLDLVRRDFFGG